MYFLDLLGTLAFAITGAYKAKGAKLNIFGIIFLGVITAVGGGTIRDLVIGRIPLFYLKDVNYLLVAVLGSILVYFIPFFLKRKYSLFRFVDSLGLSAFAIIGVSVSFEHLFSSVGASFLSFLVCIFLGILTGFGGGIVRDAVMGDTPLAFRKGSNYALSSFWGSFSFYVIYIFIGVNFALSSLISIIITLYFREVISPFGIYKKIIKNN